MLLLIYNYAFVTDGDYGAATALSVLLAVVLAVLSAGFHLATRGWSDWMSAVERGALSDADRKQARIRVPFLIARVLVLIGPRWWPASARCCGCSRHRSRRPRTASGNHSRCSRPARSSGRTSPTAWQQGRHRLLPGQHRDHRSRYGVHFVDRLLRRPATCSRSCSARRWGPLSSAAILVTLFVPQHRLARPAVPDRAETSGGPRQPDQHVLGGLAATAAASAFNVLIVKRFFDEHPTRATSRRPAIDGAGALPGVHLARAPAVASDPRRRRTPEHHLVLEGLSCGRCWC